MLPENIESWCEIEDPEDHYRSTAPLFSSVVTSSGSKGQEWLKKAILTLNLYVFAVVNEHYLSRSFMIS